MINELLDNRLEDIRRGYAADPDGDGFVCLVCGRRFARGEIFAVEGRFFEAGRAVQEHIRGGHGGMLSVLLQSEKKAAGLTENQRRLLSLIGAGRTDAEIAAQTGVTAATVRHTRFVFRERARQARLFLAAFELAEQGARRGGAGPVDIHAGARMVDDRYEVTGAEEEKILKDCFSSLEPLRLKVFSAREKKKIVILRRIAGLFEDGRPYTEKEVNAVIRPVYDDFATIRRYLIEYGFMRRQKDGSEYRLGGAE